MINVLLLAWTMQAHTADLTVSATVVGSCRVASAQISNARPSILECGRPPRIRPGVTQYGPVVVIDF